VWEHNPKAQHFYQKLGFEKFSEHQFMVGSDPQTDWLMKKKIVSV
jgi:ribosomal protein S18 acetylase RimI-like enzyme